MTNKEFENLCQETAIGTSIQISLAGEEAHGRFIGCTEDGIIVESEGRTSIWPLNLIDICRLGYQRPTYS